MAEDTQKTMKFQTEVNQLLNLMIHSLYSNREIFLRELISNGSDALDKRRFAGLTDAKMIADQGQPKIEVEMNSENHTITVHDNGIGMTREEVIDNIGTIAKSGTKAFLEKLEADQKNVSHLIGQFGVGFYSAFIVAKEIELTTRHAGSSENEATKWSSTGEESFTLENTTKASVGTSVTLFMREDHYDLINEWSLKEIIHKYSDHIAYPIMMSIERDIPIEGEENAFKKEVHVEQVNSATSLWQRDRNTITDDEYKEFYKQFSHDYQDPISWAHNKVEGNTSYISLLYIPSVAPIGMWDQAVKNGIQLYVQRVFIMEGSEKLIPRYLRFIRGIVDTQDLPLNISREILQASPAIDAIRQGIIRRSLGMLEMLSLDEDQTKYQTIWQQFGRVLKEGFGEDFSNREKLASLLRFSSTTNEKEEVSLKTYIDRMSEGQDKIYYITADSLNTAKNSPHLEIYKSKGIEVLLMIDVVDDWMMGFLNEFAGKTFVNVTKGDLRLNNDMTEEETAEKTNNSDENSVIEKIQNVLKSDVESVKISKRLTDSASCLVRNEAALSGHFEKMLKEAGHAIPEMKPWLEINMNHFLIKEILTETDEEKIADLSHLIYDEALLLEGAALDNPSAFVARLNRLMKK